MKIATLEKVPKNKIGKINTNGIKLELCEKKTLDYLILFGLNIEIIRPTMNKKMKNPDALIMGSIWEIKTLSSSNKKTVKKRFSIASKQSDKVIFDLRNIKKGSGEVEKQIMKIFKTGGNVRRIIIIEKNGNVLDISK